MVGRRKVLATIGAGVAGAIAVGNSDTGRDAAKRKATDFIVDASFEDLDTEIRDAGNQAYEEWSENEYDNLSNLRHVSEPITPTFDEKKHGWGTYFFADINDELGEQVIEDFSTGEMKSDKTSQFKDAWTNAYSSILDSQHEHMRRRSDDSDEIIESGLVLRYGESAIAKTVTREDLQEYCKNEFGAEGYSNGEFNLMLDSMRSEDVEELYEKTDWDFLYEGDYKTKARADMDEFI